MRPRLLDLFCGEGGSGMGYYQAGFDVVGVDNVAMTRYPFPFIEGDAFEYLAAYGGDFDVIHASPPCPAYSTITRDRSRHPRLISEASIRLKALGRPYVIENVDGAKRDLDNPFMLCGSSFGLAVRRHRWFESSEWLIPRACQHHLQPNPIGVYGTHPDKVAHSRVGRAGGRGVKARSLEEAQDAMGMPWASWHGCADAVPPAYTTWIGVQLLAAMKEKAG